MASTSTLSMAVPLTGATLKRQPPSADGFLKPLPLKLSSNGATVSKRVGKFEVNASWMEKVSTGFAAGALTASMVVPDVAEAASGVSPSLKNFLLSIVAGGVVVSAIVGAVVGVSNFDPVKRT